MSKMYTAATPTLLSPAATQTRFSNLQHQKTTEGLICNAEKNTGTTSQKESELRSAN